ncbi:MAG: hypothetical protein IIW77_03070 [Bacteroidaceae bacterium]|jgi:hypothetical protein|nr:hypothetical protein [Bacteroidaceae bacterium]
MRKLYSHPSAKSISVGASIMVVSGENRRKRVTTDFEEDDYDNGDGSWNIWSDKK